MPPYVLVSDLTLHLGPLDAAFAAAPAIVPATDRERQDDGDDRATAGKKKDQKIKKDKDKGKDKNKNKNKKKEKRPELEPLHAIENREMTEELHGNCG